MSLNSSAERTALPAAGWLLAALLLGGCFFHTDVPHQSTGKSPAAEDPPDKGIIRGPETSPATAQASAGEKTAGARVLLLRGGWYRIPLSGEESATAIYDLAASRQPAAPAANGLHYRHAGLEQLMAGPVAARSELPALLADNDHVVAATAAIALAREGNANAAPQLIAAAQDEQLPLAARAAAIEALGQLPGKGQVEALGRLADQYGQYIPGASTGYLADLHAELLRALARHVDAADDPRFTASVDVPSSMVRIETLRAWGEGKRGVVPMAIIDLRSNDDPLVRAAALKAFAHRKHPDAFEYLSAGLRDVDLSVRLTAIRGLGEQGDTRSQVALTDTLKDRGELVRAEVLATLAANGPQAVVLGAAADPAWRVRLEVAKALAGYLNPEGASAARRMLSDPSAEVERQVVRSMAAWPPEAALPVLLEALARDAVTVRKLAADQIVSRWKGTTRFPYEAPPARRAQALVELREQLQKYVRLCSLTEATSQAGKPDVPAPASDEQVEKLITAGDFAALANLGPGVVGSIERLAIERHITLPEPVYHEVLPRYSPVFAALDRLHSGTLDERQRAAEDFIMQKRKNPAGGLAVARLCELMTTETDGPVWIRALDAVHDDGSEPAVRMARIALSQSAGEVRRRGCDLLAAHPDAAHEAFLMPCLADSERDVVIAAIRALGAAGQIHDTGALKQQLASPQEEVQLEAAVALTRLHDAAGEAVIERLSYSQDMNVRGQLARALGDLGDIRFAAILVRLLDDSKATVSHAALASLPRVVGRDMARSDDGATVTTAEQIARWKKWYASGAP